MTSHSSGADKTPGQVAYEAYWTTFAEAKSVAPSHDWSELIDDEEWPGKRCYEAAAQAVLDMQRQQLEALVAEWRDAERLCGEITPADRVERVVLIEKAAVYKRIALNLERVLKGGE